MSPLIESLGGAHGFGLFAASGGTPIAGAYDALATITVPSGGTSSITFSGIPSTYTHLQVRYTTQVSTGGVLRLNVNGDSTYTNYSSHALYGTGSSYGAFSDTGSSYTFMDVGQAPTGTSYAAGIVDILDYASLVKNKTFRTFNGHDENGAGWISMYSSAWYNSSTAINQLTFTVNSSGNFNQYSQFALYGVK